MVIGVLLFLLQDLSMKYRINNLVSFLYIMFSVVYSVYAG